MTLSTYTCWHCTQSCLSDSLLFLRWILPYHISLHLPCHENPACIPLNSDSHPGDSTDMSPKLLPPSYLCHLHSLLPISITQTPSNTISLYPSLPSLYDLILIPIITMISFQIIFQNKTKTKLTVSYICSSPRAHLLRLSTLVLKLKLTLFNSPRQQSTTLTAASKVKFYPLARGDVFREGDTFSYLRRVLIGRRGVHLGEVVRLARNNGNIVRGAKKEQWRWEILENSGPTGHWAELGDGYPNESRE